MSLRVRSPYTLARLEVRQPPRVAVAVAPQKPSLLPVILMLLALGTLCVLCLPALASAQTRDEVEAEIEKTDRVIEKARELLDETGAPRGRGALDMAERLQNQAKQSFANNNLRIALGFTREARDRALASLAGIRRGEDNEEAVERELDRTDRVIEEVTDKFAGGPMAMRRLDQARATQNRAWELFRNRQLRPALKLTLEARDTAARMGMRARFGPGARDRLGDHVERQLERLGMAIDRVSENITADNTSGTDALNQARQSYQDAEKAYSEGQYLLAERQLRQTREALMRAVRTVEDSLSADDVQALIDDARRRWENLGEDVEGSGNSQLLTWHQEAGTDIAEAEAAVQNGELTRALVQTRSAMGLLDRIADGLE